MGSKDRRSSAEAPSAATSRILFYASYAAMLAALALAGCVGEVEGSEAGGEERPGSAAGPIQGGYADGDRASVVGLRIFSDEGRRTCSGALIAPNLVLTAQHCIAESPRRISCAESRFGDVVAPDRVYVTPSVLLCERCDVPWFSVHEVLPVPSGDDRVCGNDIALLVLDSPVPSEHATPLDPRLDEPPEQGESYAAVGFGRTGAQNRDSGVRRQLDALRVACVGAGCDTKGRVAESEWVGETGTCPGDSGGPALDVWERVIGVSSRGRGDCNHPIYSGLVPHREWIIAEGRRAAEIGGYSLPDWATGGGIN